MKLKAASKYLENINVKKSYNNSKFVQLYLEKMYIYIVYSMNIFVFRSISMHKLRFYGSVIQ